MGKPVVIRIALTVLAFSGGLRSRIDASQGATGSVVERRYTQEPRYSPS